MYWTNRISHLTRSKCFQCRTKPKLWWNQLVEARVQFSLPVVKRRPKPTDWVRPLNLLRDPDKHAVRRWRRRRRILVSSGRRVVLYHNQINGRRIHLWFLHEIVYLATQTAWTSNLTTEYLRDRCLVEICKLRALVRPQAATFKEPLNDASSWDKFVVKRTCIYTITKSILFLEASNDTLACLIVFTAKIAAILPRNLA